MPQPNIYNMASSKAVIAQVIRNFKIQDASFVEDAVEWIGEAMQAIGFHRGFQLTYQDLVVRNHKAKLPCNLVQLKHVTYMGARLLLGYDDTKTLYIQRGNKTTVRTLSEVEALELKRLYDKLEARQAEYDDSPSDDLAEIVADLQSDIDTINESKRIPDGNITFTSLPYFNVIGRYIQTSFPTGTIVVYFKQYDLDNEGYPYIVDTYKYREAVQWYIMRGALLQGFRHSFLTFRDINAFWEEFRYKASNESKQFSKIKAVSQMNAIHNPTRSESQRRELGINAEQEQGFEDI